MRTREEKMGVAQALLERLNTQRLPFLLEVEKRVDAGERLSDYELDRLQETLQDAQSNESVIAELIDEFPELQGIASRIVDLYGSITRKALENEEKGGSA